MRIATYNVNGIDGRLPVLIRWLKKFEPDVACLQEPRAPQEKFPNKDIEALGYPAIWHGQKSWNGAMRVIAAASISRLFATALGPGPSIIAWPRRDNSEGSVDLPPPEHPEM